MLKDYILQQTGLSYYGDKDEDFAMRLSRRFGARATEDCSEYLLLLTDLRGGQQEMDQLVGELTIGETYFFRQREHFDLLRNTVIPDLLERNKESRTLRIWSAGCATGAEPYSLAMLLQLDFKSQLSGWKVSIHATDLNLEFLQRACSAPSPNGACAKLPTLVRQRCFARDGNSWVLRPEFTRGVSFRYHNLATSHDLPEGPDSFDLILCRNVIIYFSREQAAATLNLLHRHLAKRGWLLVGYAEPNMEMFKAFETVATPDTTAYRKPGPSGGLAPQGLTWLPPLPPDEARRRHQSPASRPEAAPAAIPPSVSAAVPSVDDVRVLADTGHWDAATRLTGKLIQADSLNPGSHFLSALIHEHMGANDKAIVALRRAIYLDRRFALAHYHLGASLKNVRQEESASRSFRNALEILTTMGEDEPLPHGDSITAGELRTLASMHLEMSAR